jgi:hypothetical protein
LLRGDWAVAHIELPNPRTKRGLLVAWSNAGIAVHWHPRPPVKYIAPHIPVAMPKRMKSCELRFFFFFFFCSRQV